MKTGALVVTDTYAQSPDRTRHIETSKLFYLPHLGILIACRGDAGFMMSLHSFLYSEQGDADRVADAMPMIAARALANFSMVMRHGGKEPAADHHEIVVVFWSPRAGRMVGLSVRNDDPALGVAFASWDIGTCHQGVYIGPWDDSVQKLHPRPDSIEAMRRLALDQVLFMKERLPVFTPGGTLIVAECERDSAHIFSAGPLS